MSVRDPGVREARGGTTTDPHDHRRGGRDLVHDIAAVREPQPSFADGLRVQRVLDAVQRSYAAGSAGKTGAPAAT